MGFIELSEEEECIAPLHFLEQGTELEKEQPSTDSMTWSDYTAPEVVFSKFSYQTPEMLKKYGEPMNITKNDKLAVHSCGRNQWCQVAVIDKNNKESIGLVPKSILGLKKSEIDSVQMNASISHPAQSAPVLIDAEFSCRKIDETDQRQIALRKWESYLYSGYSAGQWCEVFAKAQEDQPAGWAVVPCFYLALNSPKSPRRVGSINGDSFKVPTTQGPKPLALKDGRLVLNDDGEECTIFDPSTNLTYRKCCNDGDLQDAAQEAQAGIKEEERINLGTDPKGSVKLPSSIFWPELQSKLKAYRINSVEEDD